MKNETFKNIFLHCNNFREKCFICEPLLAERQIFFSRMYNNKEFKNFKLDPIELSSNLYKTLDITVYEFPINKPVITVTKVYMCFP